MLATGNWLYVQGFSVLLSADKAAEGKWGSISSQLPMQCVTGAPQHILVQHSTKAGMTLDVTRKPCSTLVWLYLAVRHDSFGPLFTTLDALSAAVQHYKDCSHQHHSQLQLQRQ